jgi:Flp pilus assembly protein TadB
MHKIVLYVLFSISIPLLLLFLAYYFWYVKQDRKRLINKIAEAAEKLEKERIDKSLLR